MNGHRIEWGPYLDQLKRLFAEGLTAAEIGRRLGLSKSAVIAKLHRLELVPSRGKTWTR